MGSEEMFALIAVERRRAADMFAGLTEEQWQVRSLCTEWTVRDLAGHLIGPFCIGTTRFLLGGLRERLGWAPLAGPEFSGPGAG